jgi:hypothetical protein
MKRLDKQLHLLLAVWLLPILLSVAVPATLQAQFTFTTNNGAITITGYTGTNGETIIPDTINGLPVTSIADVAFSYANVTSVTIPDSVTNIGSGAFQQCSSLTNVMIGTNVTCIASFAFYGCTSLPSIIIPASATNISGWVLNDCPSLMAISVDTNNPAYSSVDGILFDNNLTTLIQYPGGKPGSYSVPDSVTNIAGGAFYVCVGLTNVTIPNSITSITGYAFENCYSLLNITISDTVTNIGDGAFANTGLTSITIPNRVTSIGSSAFSGCGGLTNVVIPNSVSSIGESAFGSCGNLTAITVDASNSAYCSVEGVLLNKSQSAIVEFPAGKGGSYAVPDGVTNIGAYTFFKCTHLTSVTVPNSVTSIGLEAFAFCYNLTNIALSDRITSIADTTFNNCIRLTNVTIPNGVKSIESGAFNNCVSLHNITIPGTVTNIVTLAFYSCTNLTSIFFQGKPPTLGGTPFARDPATVYYLPGNPDWQPLAQNPKVRIGVSYGAGIVRTNQFGFNITGSSNLVILVQGCSSLTNNVWSTVATNRGSSYFGDSQWTNYPARFYRLLPPTFGGQPTVLWNPVLQTTDGSFGLRSNQFGFNITGTANIPIVVEARTDFGNAWVPLQSVSLTNGSFYFSDPLWTNYTSRFYRIRSP